MLAVPSAGKYDTVTNGGKRCKLVPRARKRDVRRLNQTQNHDRQTETFSYLASVSHLGSSDVYLVVIIPDVIHVALQCRVVRPGVLQFILHRLVLNLQLSVPRRHCLVLSLHRDVLETKSRYHVNK